MEERLKRYYTHEEDFVGEYEAMASAAAQVVDGEWRPNEDCDTTDRRNRDYFKRTGQLYALCFDGAAVYCDSEGLVTSAQIILENSFRAVTVKVTVGSGEGHRAEIIIDRETSSEESAE